MSSNNGKKIEAVYNAISNMQSALNGLQRAAMVLELFRLKRSRLARRFIGVEDEGRGRLLPGQVPGAGWWPAALPETINTKDNAKETALCPTERNVESCKSGRSRKPAQARKARLYSLSAT